MKYPFPIIRHIDDVLPHIEGCKDFIVAKKDGYDVINYVVAGNDTFPIVQTVGDAIRRECRGLIFCSRTGQLLRRPLHKFFNLGERTETLPDAVDFREPHFILDKLDGSMIAPFMLHGRLRWGTKMGLTDVASQAEDWVEQHPKYLTFAAQMVSGGFTPIFEWCSPLNQIVIRHDVSDLFLLAVRHIMTGQYVPLHT